MLKTIKEILKTGDATVKYPAEPLERPEYARGKPEHDSKACIACAACAVACPPNAIQMQMDPRKGTITWSINYGRCVFCGRCEEVCPTKAIELSKEFELAVMDKNDLEETCTYPLQKCAECGAYFASAKEVDYAARILSQNAGEADVDQAFETITTCPKCKQKADAYRAKRRSETMMEDQR
jgi:hydrogenase-4 component H